MKTAQLILCLVISFSSLAYATDRFVSAIPSSLDGISIPNAQEVSPRIFRGMMPIGRAQLNNELARKLGITDVLILDFANQWDVDDPNNPDNEKKMLKDAKFTERSPVQSRNPGKGFYHIPLKFKDLDPFPQSCRTIVSVLKIMKSVSENWSEPRRKVYLHCTVGEDRTGMIVGLYRLLLHPGWTTKSVFVQDMCVRGYEAGNPRKFATAKMQVIEPMRKELTPFFLKMVNKIKNKKLQWSNLSDGTCDEDPTLADNEAEQYTCTTSPLAKTVDDGAL